MCSKLCLDDLKTVEGVRETNSYQQSTRLSDEKVHSRLVWSILYKSAVII